jgi:hypothetical protein
VADLVALAHHLAAFAECDHRTALVALRKGPEKIRTRVVRERVLRELPRLESLYPTNTSSAPPTKQSAPEEKGTNDGKDMP